MDHPESNKSYCSRFLQQEIHDNNKEQIGLQLLHCAVKVVHEFPNKAHCNIIGYMFTKMLGMQGIKKHCAVAIQAITEEFTQIDEKGMFEPKKLCVLTKQQQKR